MKQPRLDSEEQLGAGSYLEVVRKKFVDVEGRIHSRDIVKTADAVALVPYESGKVYLIRQWRPAVGKEITEIPAGKLDIEGEAPAEAAARECSEETGWLPRDVRRMRSILPSPGYSSETIEIFLGLDLVPSPRRPDGFEEEHAEVIAIDLDDALHQVTTGEITDAKTVIGLIDASRFLDH